MHGHFKNTILSRLDGSIISRLQPQRIELERRHILENPGESIRDLYFLEEGVASMTASFQDGAEVEVGMFGCESVVGVAALIGTRRGLYNIYMQLAGWGYSVPVRQTQDEFKRGEHFHDLVLRYLQANLMQTAQTAGCNARHPLEQRLSRWLLLCQDRAGRDTMDLTQELLATMLGVDRPAVSIVAGRLQESKLIEYHRGKVRILDRPGLERLACECYTAVRNYLNRYAVPDEGLG